MSTWPDDRVTANIFEGRAGDALIGIEEQIPVTVRVTDVHPSL